MKNLQKIQELQAGVNAANTADADGRQVVASACTKLYNTIEEDIYNAGAEWMLNGLYIDLHNSNFAEPFMCEMMKTTFATVVKVYEDRILPRL